MKEHSLGGNIMLAGFELDNQEMIVAKKLIGNYAQKIRNFAEYEEIKLEMKTHLKGKNKHFEINALVKTPGHTANSKSEGLNPFILIDEVLAKILNEIKHKIRK